MANTVTFVWPNAAPATAVITECVRGTISFDGGTAGTTITHNLGFTAAELAFDQPEVIIESTSANFYTEHPFIATKTANTVTLTGAAAAASTCNFTIRRASSLIS